MPMTINRSNVKERLVPGGAQETYTSLRQRTAEEPVDGWLVYALSSSIKAAIRERADDHARSTERSESSSASAVSPVVSPAK